MSILLKDRLFPVEPSTRTLARQLFEIHKKDKIASHLVEGYLLLDDIFPSELRRNDIFRTTLEEVLVRQINGGTLKSSEKVLA